MSSLSRALSSGAGADTLEVWEKRVVCELELWSNNDGLFSDDNSIFESDSTSESPQRSPLGGAVLGSVLPTSGAGLSRLNI